jgi:hypothetical protein
MREKQQMCLLCTHSSVIVTSRPGADGFPRGNSHQSLDYSKFQMLRWSLYPLDTGEPLVVGP